MTSRRKSPLLSRACWDLGIWDGTSEGVTGCPESPILLRDASHEMGAGAVLKLGFCWARTLHPFGGTFLQRKGTEVDRDLQLQEREEVQKDVVRNGLGAVGAELQHSHWERPTWD